MANFIAYTSFDANNFPFATSSTSYPIATSTHVRETWGNSTANYYGTGFVFTGDPYGGYGISSGTLTGGDYRVGGVLRWEVTGLNHNAMTIWNYIVAKDDVGLQAYALNGADQIVGSGGNDLFKGYGGNDQVKGNGGNDKLYGQNGNDALVGGVGNDYANGGAGNDTLNGGAGNDSLFGDAGNDIFLFNSALGADNIDTIGGFLHTPDVIRLDDDIFTTLNTGANHALTAAQYKENTTGQASDSSDRIIYNTSNGALFYDPDGNGAAAPVKFAVLSGAPDIDQTDFFVVT